MISNKTLETGHKIEYVVPYIYKTNLTLCLMPIMLTILGLAKPFVIQIIHDKLLHSIIYCYV